MRSGLTFSILYIVMAIGPTDCLGFSILRNGLRRPDLSEHHNSVRLATSFKGRCPSHPDSGNPKPLPQDGSHHGCDCSFVQLSWNSAFGVSTLSFSFFQVTLNWCSLVIWLFRSPVNRWLSLCNSRYAVNDGLSNPFSSLFSYFVPFLIVQILLQNARTHWSRGVIVTTESQFLKKVKSS